MTDPASGAHLVADHLTGCRRQVTRRWLRALRQQLEIRRASHEATRQLINQLPRLFDELCLLLRDGAHDELKMRVQRDAQVHAAERWRQGFALDELFLELDLLQRCVQASVREYYVAAPSRKGQAVVHQLIERFFSHVIRDAIAYVQKEQDKRVSEALHERNHALAAQQRSDERLRIAAAAAGLGIFEWNPETDVAIWENERMYELTGQPREKGPLSARAFIRTVVLPEDAGNLTDALSKALMSGDAFHAVPRVRTLHTGTARVLEMSGRFLPDAAADRGILVGTLVDVTERVRAEEALREADRRKDVFLATLGHELRNPLAPILNAAHLLSSASGDRLSWLQGLIERHATHLSHLIDDLLDLSRITAGKITLRTETFAIQNAIDRAIEINAPAAALHGHRLEVIGAGAITSFVLGDATRITQVLANLLDNAIKYTPDGGRIRLLASNEGDYVQIIVEDNGIGMDPIAIPSIFQMFEQMPNGPSGGRTGLGIGLSVANSLVAMHGGSISASSEGLGKGSRFTVRLALCDAPAGCQTTQSPDDSAAHGLLRILVVDDNEDAALSLAMILDAHEVRTANSGETAISIARDFRPDAVLLDIGLPDMSGYEVAEHLKRLEGNPRPLLIALTGYGQPADKARTRDAGFDHHLVKPARPADILNLLALKR